MTKSQTPASVACEEHLREMLAAGPVPAREATLALRREHNPWA